MDDRKLCLLMILDGWGVSDSLVGNAVAQADTPFLDRLIATYPRTTLRCSGEAVGLPPGIMGNSEVGHLNIGAGRIVFQDLLRIDRSIADRTFFANPALNGLMQKVKAGNSALHLIGLVSDGGVHSHLRHLEALLAMAAQSGVARVFVHAILDGRDTPPDSGAGYLETVKAQIRRSGCGAVASVVGRYFAMDRDTRWDRIQQAYRLFTQGEGRAATEPVAAIQEAYGRGETDEFVRPIVMTGAGGRPVATVADGDGVICFNFRADRVREITRALTAPGFDAFSRPVWPQLCEYVCLTMYDETFTLPVAYPPVHLSNILGEVVSRQGLNQLRVAETEKYAHVTYFFNGGEEKPFANEDRSLIPSPREVATYDQKPEMSALEVTEEVVRRIDSDRYDLIVLNFANMDMVGHSGVLEAAVKACETVDRCAARIVERVRKRKGVVLVTADHGNSETMISENGTPHTAHTLNPVNFILVDDARIGVRLRHGILADIAPTILEILGVAQPAEMTGRSLIEAVRGTHGR